MMRKATSLLAVRGAARGSTGQRCLFSAVLGRSRPAVVTSRAVLVSLRTATHVVPSAPSSQQRWYATEEKESTADGEVSAEDAVQEAIKKVVVAEYPCVVFMKGTPDAPQCGFSNATIKALNTVGAKYEAFDVLQSAELRDGIKKFTDWPTIPQVFIGGEFVGGCDITLQHLRSGELTTLLEKAKALKTQQ